MYENSIIHPKSILHSNTSKLGTIKVLDEFIKSGEKYFCIKDNFTFYYNDKYYEINFIISRKEQPTPNIAKSNITMTDFKKIYTIPRYKDLNQITNCLNHDKEYFKLTNIPKISLPVFDFICTFRNIFINNSSYNSINNVIINFPIPIAINAQSSADTYYGNYNWYGDTSVYLIVGYMIKDIINI